MENEKQPEQYGGTTKDQTDVAQNSLRYQNRFEPDRPPQGHNGLGTGTEKVENC